MLTFHLGPPGITEAFPHGWVQSVRHLLPGVQLLHGLQHMRQALSLRLARPRSTGHVRLRTDLVNPTRTRTRTRTRTQAETRI